MGFFSKIKKVAKKATRTVRKVSKVVKPVRRVAKKVTSKVGAGTLYRATNIRQLIKNPTSYVRSVSSAVKKDLSTASRIYSAASTGNYGQLVKTVGNATGVKQISNLSNKISSAVNQVQAARNIYNQVSSGNYKGAVQTARAAGGTLGKLGNTANQAMSVYSNNLSLVRDLQSGNISSIMSRAQSAIVNRSKTTAARVTANMSPQTRTQSSALRTGNAVARTPLAVSKQVLQAKNDPNSLILAARMDKTSTRTTISPAGWPAYRSNKDTLGGLL